MKKFFFWGFSIYLRVVFLLVLVRQPIGIIKLVLIEGTKKNYVCGHVIY